MDIARLEKFLTEKGQPKFRAEQIKKAVFQDGIASFSEMTNLPKNLRETLEKEIQILPFAVEKVLVSGDKKSAKALFKLADGNLLESVLISPLENTWSVCVSSQVGCALGCRFCATGKMGFKRNLSAEEIEGQVLFWKGFLRNPLCPEYRTSPPDYRGRGKMSDISNVVYMGMGEPFLNWEEVKESLKILTDKKLFGMSSRSLSVSTSGLPEGIEKLGRTFPQVNLAISLHAATDEKRSSLMPINQKNNLADLREALKKYFTLTNRKVFLEYIMLEKINDSRTDAKDLARFVKSIGKLQLLHINLIRYNTTGTQFGPSSKERTLEFKKYLNEKNLSVTIRKSLGEEVKGACGQLACKN